MYIYIYTDPYVVGMEPFQTAGDVSRAGLREKAVRDGGIWPAGGPRAGMQRCRYARTEGERERERYIYIKCIYLYIYMYTHKYKFKQYIYVYEYVCTRGNVCINVGIYAIYTRCL